MYRRSEIRHACYRAKNNAVSESNRVILDLVEPMLAVHQRWENFSIVWDVIVTRDGKIQIVNPETSYDFIHTTALKAQIYKEAGKDFASMSDREHNIIMQIEQLMLDGIMSWDTYNKTWGVQLDASSNVIKTVQYNVKSTQLEVTPEMIEASKKDADGSAFTEKEPNILEAKPMSDDHKKAFEEFLAKQYKD